MTNPLTSVVQPEVLEENKMTINSFLKQSYDQAKKQLEDGVSFLQDGISFIKDEFSSLYNQTGDCLNKMVSPVNNFLKDPTQIDAEFKQEEFKIAEQSTSSNIIPLEIALLSPMEENY